MQAESCLWIECVFVREASLTEVIFHAEVRHELFEDVERIVEMKCSIEKVFREIPIDIAV